jgi:branched-chain amino acid transport system substrate-binding protein
MLHDLFVVRVKKPEESQAKGDYFAIVETVPGEQAFQTAARSACKALK